MSHVSIHLGYEVGTGAPVSIPLRHLVVTGQTQEAGKTTALEALIARSGVKAIVFVTKRGEGSFVDARIIPPYFREKADWQFVASILEASRGEKLKFERAWIIRASKGARTLADVHHNVRKAMETAKGLSADVYLTLDAYLDAVVPQIDRVRWAARVDLAAGVNAMDLTGLNVEMQHLVIRSTIEWVQEQEKDTVVVVPEAWKFIPQGRGTPVKLAAEAFIRQAAALRNFLWLDSQDIAGVEKIILKSVPVWILGVQRESNEVKRTLDQIPAGIKKPKLEAVATLGLGQFFACYGTHVIKVYVEPVWMHSDDARGVAMGRRGILPQPNRPPRGPMQEAIVTEAEARELRAENADLRRRLAELEGHAESSNRKATADVPASGHRDHGDAGRTPASAAARPAREWSAGESMDNEQLYQAIKARLIDELPQDARVLQIIVQRPELRVEVERHVIKADGHSLRGRIGRMIAGGFFEKSVTSAQVLAELQRQGENPSNIELGNELKALTVLGFFTRDNKWFSLVDGMKVNVVEK